MAFGLPVIATIADGTEQDLIIHGENGFIAKVDDSSELANYMMQLLLSNELRLKMGTKSQQMIASNASLDGMINSFSTAMRRFL